LFSNYGIQTTERSQPQIVNKILEQAFQTKTNLSEKKTSRFQQDNIGFSCTIKNYIKHNKIEFLVS